MHVRLRPPLWLGIALLVGLAGALLAIDRATLAAALAEQRASDASAARLREILPPLVRSLGTPPADAHADPTAPLARLGIARPAELRRLLLRAPDGRVWTHDYGPPSAAHDDLLARAWAASGDGRALDDEAGVAVVWQLVERTGWTGWRIAVVGSLAASDAVAAEAQRHTLLLLGVLSLATLCLTKQISQDTAIARSSMPEELVEMINRGAGLNKTAAAAAVKPKCSR